MGFMCSLLKVHQSTHLMAAESCQFVRRPECLVSKLLDAQVHVCSLKHLYLWHRVIMALYVVRGTTRFLNFVTPGPPKYIFMWPPWLKILMSSLCSLVRPSFIPYPNDSDVAIQFFARDLFIALTTEAECTSKAICFCTALNPEGYLRNLLKLWLDKAKLQIILDNSAILPVRVVAENSWQLALAPPVIVVADRRGVVTYSIEVLGTVFWLQQTEGYKFVHQQSSFFLFPHQWWCFFLITLFWNKFSPPTMHWFSLNKRFPS
jgi:hypothetical protein